MDTKTGIIIALVALIIGCGAGIVARTVMEPEASAYTGQTWEHMCTNLEWDDMNGKPILANVGNAGWEMAGVTAIIRVGVAMKIYACFKRPKQAGQ